MNVILLMVMSVDGKITPGYEPSTHGWSSPEDHAYFHAFVSSHNLLVMGRKTYESIRSQIKRSTNICRIVLTKKPKQYKAETVAGQLEFSAETPRELIERLEKKGYTTMLLVGGSELNTAFLSERLITECYITVEPRFFGSGKSVFTDINADIQLKLKDIQKLNEQGTLVLHYSLLYDR